MRAPLPAPPPRVATVPIDLFGPHPRCRAYAARPDDERGTGRAAAEGPEPSGPRPRPPRRTSAGRRRGRRRGSRKRPQCRWPAAEMATFKWVLAGRIGRPEAW